MPVESDETNAELACEKMFIERSISYKNAHTSGGVSVTDSLHLSVTTETSRNHMTVMNVVGVLIGRFNTDKIVEYYYYYEIVNSR